MFRCWTVAVVLVLTFAAGSCMNAEEKGKTRNPFKVKDVPDPYGKDVKSFAATVKLGADLDPNARQWAAKASSLDGKWSSRWNVGAGSEWIAGTATVEKVGDRVYILYKDPTNTYLIEAKLIGKSRLVGRYLNLGVNSDSFPWVGEIVNDERIDGMWTMGRWDLRRKIARKK